MIRLGPITIMRSSTHAAYRNVVRAAWPLHQFIWFYGENRTFPPDLSMLPTLDAPLADALSRVSPEDTPET